MTVNWFKRKSVIPGFGLTLGFTLTYMSLIILLPLAATFVKTSELSWGEFWSAVTSDRVVGSYKITFGTSLAAALFNVPCGVMLAWVLARYEFPGGVWWTRWWICRSHCRRLWRGSR